jgi:hypothetical protein
MVARQSTLRYFRAKAESTTTDCNREPDEAPANDLHVSKTSREEFKANVSHRDHNRGPLN